MSTITSTISPPLTTGVNCASDPDNKLTSGSLIKLIISDAPYPTPLFDKWIDVISPLIIGWTLSSNVSDPTEVIPTSPVILTVISW